MSVLPSTTHADANAPVHDHPTPEYRKIEIDNAICARRFHISYEANRPDVEAKVTLTCPHCGVVIFEAENHPPALIAREENLVKQPDGSRPMIYECRFKTL